MERRIPGLMARCEFAIKSGGTNRDYLLDNIAHWRPQSIVTGRLDGKPMEWEYLLLERNGRYWAVNGQKDDGLTGKPSYEVFDRFGKLGWELVNFFERDRVEAYFYFKRPVR